MQLKKLALAATATSLFAVAAAATAAGSLAPIPVNITGQIDAACSTTTSTLAFDFGTLIAGTFSAASEETATLNLDCSTGTSVSLSTASSSAGNSYAIGKITAGTPGNPGSDETFTESNGFDPADPQGSFEACVTGDDADPSLGTPPALINCPVQTGNNDAVAPTSGTPESFAQAGKVLLAQLSAGTYSPLDTVISATGGAQAITLAARVVDSAATDFDGTTNKVPDNTGAFTDNGAMFYVTF